MFNLSSSTMLLVDVSLAAGPKNIRNVYWIHDCHTCESRLASLYVSLDPIQSLENAVFEEKSATVQKRHLCRQNISIYLQFNSNQENHQRNRNMKKPHFLHNLFIFF